MPITMSIDGESNTRADPLGQSCMSAIQSRRCWRGSWPKGVDFYARRDKIDSIDVDDLFHYGQVAQLGPASVPVYAILYDEKTPPRAGVLRVTLGTPKRCLPWTSFWCTKQHDTSLDAALYLDSRSTCLPERSRSMPGRVVFTAVRQSKAFRVR